MNFTQIPNWLLDKPNNLTHAEFRVLMAIYRLTAGYHRKKYPISYSKIKTMSSVKKVSEMMKSLKEKKFIEFESVKGKISKIMILQPITSGQQSDNLRSTHQSPEVITYRGAKENLNKYIKKEKTIYSYDEMVSLCISKGLEQDKDFERVDKKFRRIT